MRIETNYNANNEGDLLAEVNARKAEGSPNFGDITPETGKPDLVAALNLDDEHKAEVAKEKSNEGLPEVEEMDDAPKDLTEVWPEAKDYKGRFRKKSDGLIYALAVTDDTIRGRTHKARNTKFTWEGSRTEFEDQFVKE